MNCQNVGSNNDEKIIHMPKLDFPIDPRGVGYIFYKHMLLHKDKIAQIDGITGEKETYGSLLKRCIRTAITMRAKGVTPGDIVTLCTYNHLNTVVPYLATLLLGATISALDPTLALQDTIHLLKQVTPKMIFVAPEAVQLIEEAVEDISLDATVVVFGSTRSHVPFSDFLQPSDEESSFEPAEAKSPHDTTLIFFSSGTTGLPKGLCTGHYAFIGQIVNSAGFRMNSDLVLACASHYWITASLFWGICILKGTTRLILPRYDPSSVWKLIDKYKPTLMFLAPSQILALASEGRPEGYNVSSLENICVGGGTMLEEQMVRVRELLPETNIFLVYGQTEVGYITVYDVEDPKQIAFIRNKPMSSGTGLPGMSYKVVDPDTEELLGPYQQGELRMKTDYQFNGYFNQDSSDVWDAEGWVKSGDIGYYDDDRCFYIVDRIKEMLKFQSWHVPPAIIENVLLTHPDIETTVVLGKPHELDGDHPMALVVLKEGSVMVSPEEIIAFVDEKVHDRQRLRGGVKIVPSLPMTPTEKVQRRQVRNMVRDGII